MPSLESALAAALDALPRARAGAPPDTVTGTVVELAPLFGAERRTQATNMAMLLSGTSDKSSRAYRSARRSVERYLKEPGTGETRTPRGPRLTVIRQAAEARVNPRLLHARITADQGPCGYERWRTAAATLDESGTARLLFAHDTGGDTAGAFLDAFARAYGTTSWCVGEVRSLTLTPVGRV